jgi:hypothetical protein
MHPFEVSDVPAAIETPRAELTCSTVRSEQGSLDATTEGENSAISKAKAMLATGISFIDIVVSLD